MADELPSNDPARERPSEGVGDADTGEPEFGADFRDELAYRLRQQELIADFGLFVLKAAGIDEVMHEATRVAALGMNVTLCKLLEYREETDDLLVRTGVGWRQGTIGVARLEANTGSPAGYAYREQQAVLSNHLSSEDRFRTPRLLNVHGVRRALNVPVKYLGAPYGVLEVDSDNSGKFTTADIAFMQSIANTLSVAIERHADERELSLVREREALLAAEMRHRVKNILAVVSALISMTRREAVPDANAYADLLEGRIAALSSATDAGLGEDRDQANTEGIDPVDLSRRVLAPYGNCISVTGETRFVSSNDATPLALILHELATNAVKYGALSGAEGHLHLEWDTVDASARLQWTEHDGPRIESPTASDGFGQRMINRMLRSIGATIERDWRESGLVAVVTLA